MILFTMYFSKGTIPHYLLYKDLGLLNHPLVLIILQPFRLLHDHLRTLFYSIPDSLRESAEIDGPALCGSCFPFTCRCPSRSCATLSLFYAVGRWNGFSDALMYMNNRHYHPIQLLLYNILNAVTSIEIQTQEGFASAPGLSDTIQAATVMFCHRPHLAGLPLAPKVFHQRGHLRGAQGLDPCLGCNARKCSIQT